MERKFGILCKKTCSFLIHSILETILNIDSNSFFPEQNIVKCVFCSVCLKSRIRETLSLSTCVDSITDLYENRWKQLKMGENWWKPVKTG